MKKEMLMRKALCYLIQPEDSTLAAGQYGHHADRKRLETEIPWIGTAKAVFWAIMAIFGPLGLVTLTM